MLDKRILLQGEMVIFPQVSKQMKLSRLTRSIRSTKRDGTKFIAHRSATLSNPAKRQPHHRTASSPSGECSEKTEPDSNKGDIGSANNTGEGSNSNVHQAFQTVVRTNAPVHSEYSKRISNSTVSVDWEAVCDCRRNEELPQNSK